jgi:hypothetical protein
VSGIHWGEGSALTTVELLYAKYRDAYVNIGLLHGVGINGCTVSNVHQHEESPQYIIQFDLHTEYAWKRPLVVVIDNGLPAQAYFVVVNDQPVGEFQPDELKAGVPIPPSVL